MCALARRLVSRGQPFVEGRRERDRVVDDERQLASTSAHVVTVPGSGTNQDVRSGPTADALSQAALVTRVTPDDAALLIERDATFVLDADPAPGDASPPSGPAMPRRASERH